MVVRNTFIKKNDIIITNYYIILYLSKGFINVCSYNIH